MASTTSHEPVAFPPTVVLGASGRVGQILQTFWTDFPVTWTSRRGENGLVQFDVLQDANRLMDIAQDASVVICLAGVVPGRGDLSVNADIACAAISAAAHSSIDTVILCSSAAVYGRGDVAWREDMPTKPLGLYGKSKLQMEHVAKELASTLGVSVCSLRIANVAGADAILAGWKSGFQLDQLPDGTTPLRSYIGPQALSMCLSQLVAKANQLPEVLNVAASKPVRMGDLLDSAGLAWASKQANADTIAQVVLDVSRLSGLLDLDLTLHDVTADWASWQTQRAAT